MSLTKVASNQLRPTLLSKCQRAWIRAFLCQGSGSACVMSFSATSMSSWDLEPEYGLILSLLDGRAISFFLLFNKFLVLLKRMVSAKIWQGMDGLGGEK